MLYIYIYIDLHFFAIYIKELNIRFDEPTAISPIGSKFDRVDIGPPVHDK
jgi:hypothetical protein